jgi:hypothetical protein
MKRIIVTVIVFISVLGMVKAQEFSVGADLVSSYVWRGVYQGGGASIQPSVGLSVSGFSLSAWGSSNISGGNKEVDFTVGYEVAGLSLGITDYWWNGEGTQKYFYYDTHNDAGHVFEFSAGYTLPVETFPLHLSWNTFFTGYDYYTAKDDGSLDRSYSTYIEASYPFSVKEVSLEAALGLTPWEGSYAADFSVVNISLKASKEIKITDSFSLPVFGQVITNPRSEDIFFVFGVSF